MAPSYSRPHSHAVPECSIIVVRLFVILLLTFSKLSSAYTPLSDTFLGAIPSGGDDLDPRTGSLLAPILTTRIPGTEKHARVQEHFVGFFQTQLPKWTIKWQNSSSTTPVSNGKALPFRNLIFKREPPWVKTGQSNLLTLVAHYDSKLKPDGFIGAIDSAVPCAILMHTARTLDKYLTHMHEDMSALGEGGSTETDMGVQILLLDGEEAFISWTATDSLYGSRALAEEWEETHHPPLSFYQNPLGQISMFVLLDLLGSADPKIPSYFLTTHWAYQGMAAVESRMRSLGLLESTPLTPFLFQASQPAGRTGGISDDHLPFMSRGVPILHIIPSPFPDVWHTMDDDGAHLDMPTVRDWARIVTAFAFEWLDIIKVRAEPGTMGDGRLLRTGKVK